MSLSSISSISCFMERYRWWISETSFLPDLELLALLSKSEACCSFLVQRYRTWYPHSHDVALSSERILWLLSNNCSFVS